MQVYKPLDLLRVFLALELEVLCPRKTLSHKQIRTDGHPMNKCGPQEAWQSSASQAPAMPYLKVQTP